MNHKLNRKGRKVLCKVCKEKELSVLCDILANFAVKIKNRQNRGKRKRSEGNALNGSIQQDKTKIS